MPQRVPVPNNRQVFWAYWRPKVTITIHSNGNAVKTVLTNISDLAQSLKVPEKGKDNQQDHTRIEHH